MMPRKKTKSKNQLSVKVGNLTGVSGTVNIASGNIEVHQTPTQWHLAEINQLFDPVYAAIESRGGIEPSEKEALKAEVDEIQSSVAEAAQKNEPVDESFLARRFRNVARMAPDVADVVLKTLVNPALGIAEVVKKISEKANEDAYKE